MRQSAQWSGLWSRLTGLAGRYKYVLLVLAAGVVLLLLPDGDGRRAAGQTGAEAAGTGETAARALEQRLERALSQVEGAGEVTVVLTVEGSGRKILAQDTVLSRHEGEQEDSRSTVVVAQGSGQQGTVPLQQLSPEFRGALVVCSGGGDPAVRLQLTQAVAALTGLGSDRISVCTGR